jgi:hypothetical protein
MVGAKLHPDEIISFFLASINFEMIPKCIVCIIGIGEAGAQCILTLFDMLDDRVHFKNGSSWVLLA